MKYEYKTVKAQRNMFGNIFEEHRKVIDDMAKNGYRYIGYIPVKLVGYGIYNRLYIMKG